MGDDFSCHMFFAGEAKPEARREALIARLTGILRESGFVEVPDEEDATRSFVVGPAARWVFLGDSAGSTDWADPEAFDALSGGLSLLGPVVDVKMSDSAVVHFYQYRAGGRVDRFGNGAFPFHRFTSEDERAAFRGDPELWKDLLISPDSVQALRTAWVQEWEAGAILGTTARLLGWDERLLYVGYTRDEEGIPIRYDEALRLAVDLRQFREYHFNQSISVSRPVAPFR